MILFALIYLPGCSLFLFLFALFCFLFLCLFVFFLSLNSIIFELCLCNLVLFQKFPAGKQIPAINFQTSIIFLSTTETKLLLKFFFNLKTEAHPITNKHFATQLNLLIKPGTYRNYPCNNVFELVQLS